MPNAGACVRGDSAADPTVRLGRFDHFQRHFGDRAGVGHDRGNAAQCRTRHPGSPQGTGRFGQAESDCRRQTRIRIRV